MTGVALAPETTPNHWDLLGLNMASHMVDIRDRDALARVVADAQPEVVFHLAAQPQRNMDSVGPGGMPIGASVPGSPLAMGMSLRTSDGWRYTRWVRWVPDRLAPDWAHDYGEELYDLRRDSVDGDLDAQSDNVVSTPENAALVASLRVAMQQAFHREQRS